MNFKKIYILVIGFLLLNPIHIFAQVQEGIIKPDQSADTNLSITKDIINSDLSTLLKEAIDKKERIESSQEIEEEKKNNLLNIYQDAIENFRSASEYKNQLSVYESSLQNIPSELEKTEKLLKVPGDINLPEIPDDVSLEQAEKLLKKSQTKLDEAKETITTLDEESKTRAAQTLKIPEQIRQANKELENIEKQISELDKEQLEPDILKARKTLLVSERLKNKYLIEAKKTQLKFYNTSRELLSLQRDLTSKELNIIQDTVSKLNEKVANLRKQKAQQAREEAIKAKEKSEELSPVIKEIAQENTELTRLQNQLVNNLEFVQNYTNKLNTELSEISSEYASLENRIESTEEISHTMGMALLNKRRSLPDITDNKQKIKKRPEKTSLAQFNWSENDKRLAELRNPEDEIEEIIERLDPSISTEKKEEIKEEVRNLLEKRKETLSEISGLYLDYISVLGNLDSVERNYVEAVEEFKSFIDANIMWVKSSPAIRSEDIKAISPALKWVFGPSNWKKVTCSFYKDIKKHPLNYMTFLIVVIAYCMLRIKINRSMADFSAKIKKETSESFSYALLSLFYIIAAAFFWPFIILSVQWRLGTISEESFTRIVSSSLFVITPTVFVAAFLWQFSKPNGLAVSYLKLREKTVRFFRKLAVFYFSIIIILKFVIQILEEQKVSEQWFYTVGRPLFMAGLLVLAIFLFLLLNPRWGVLRKYFKNKKLSWVKKTWLIWYCLSFGLPVLFAILAGLGYFYAARHLYEKLVYTIAFITIILIIRIILIRWLRIARKGLAIIELLRRDREEKEEIVPQKKETAKPSEEKSIFDLSIQTKKIINFVTAIVIIYGIWYIWKNIIPAFGFLQKIELWKMADAKGAVTAITLWSLITTLVILIFTAILAKNIPGALEIIILRRVNIDRGVRFAITTLTRYVIVVVGIIMAFSAIGIGWSKIQWLVAAVSVGLGFGLQEIFANFVSGLIILFEQPIRVDDVVTIGDVTGKIEYIKIRATSIRRWDQKEFIVPNKEFITGRLINWTLSDTTIRKDFQVGIAYGSDIKKAEKLLYEIADSHPEILKEPSPMVIFREFGSSSLLFELRVYISGIEQWLKTWHEINCLIDTEFKKAGIEIAFPQQDLHVRSVKADFPVNIKRNQSPETE